MEEGKGQTIFLSIIGIATLLVAIVGATFAWFSIPITGNDNPADIVITSSNLGQVSFNDGTAIDLGRIMPGTFTTKTFTVSQTDPSATGRISYRREKKRRISRTSKNKYRKLYYLRSKIIKKHDKKNNFCSKYRRE